jgi:hypothetical protein
MISLDLYGFADPEFQISSGASLERPRQYNTLHQLISLWEVQGRAMNQKTAISIEKGCHRKSASALFSVARFIIGSLLFEDAIDVSFPVQDTKDPH